MTKRARVLLGAGLLCSAGVVLLFFVKRSGLWDRPVEGVSALETGRGEAEEPPMPVASSALADPRTGSGAPGAGTRHVASDGSAITGRVVDEEGNGLPSAAIHLVALTPRDTEWEPSWRAGEWGELDSPSARTESDAMGAFRFASWIGPPEGGAFVVSAQIAGFETAFEHAVYSPDGISTVELVLRPARPVEVLVLDEEGMAVPEASVQHFGVASQGARWRSGDERGLWQRYANETLSTDADGLVEFARLPGEQVFVASSGERRSLPWRGEPDGRVVLRLLPTFSLAARITLPDWSALNYEGERRLRVTVTSGGLERTLVVARHIEAGDWGPLAIPLLESTTYTVHLEGSPIIPVRERFASPVAGSSVTVQLVADLGSNLWLQVTDLEGTPLTDSEATLSWKRDGVGNHVTRRSQEDGYINLWSIPPVTFDITASAPGYATETFLDRELPPGNDYLDVKLARAGRIRGRCTCEGEPVPDFSILVYENVTRKESKSQFFGREDGSFELDDVATGQVFLIASSDALPPCEPIPVTVPLEGEAEVSVELARGWPGSGKILDGETKRPIAGARIRRSVVETTSLEETWGPVLVTDAAGAFTLDSLPEGITLLIASAPGYATAILRAQGGSSADRTPMLVELERPVSLHLQLTGLEPGSYGGFTASCALASRPLSETSFDADGRLEFDSISPGFYDIEIRGGGGVQDNTLRDVELELLPRTTTFARVRAGGANSLALELPKGTVRGPDDSVWARVRFRTPEGWDATVVVAYEEEDSLQVDGVEADSVWAEVFRTNGERLGAASGVFRDGRLTLHFDGSGKRFHLLVVDRVGDPLSGVDVRTIDPVSGSFGALGTTDSNGTLELLGLPDHEVFANLYKSTVGVMPGVRIDGKKSGGEITLDGTGRMRIRVQHGGAPLPGADAEFLLADRLVYFTLRRSDSDGVLVWDAVTPGLYRVRILHPGFWTQELSARAESVPQLHSVELRRLTSLDLRLLSAEGLPVSNQELHLIDETSGEEVDPWIEDGRVTTSGPTTDTRGAIRFDGLPEGSYRASVSGGVWIATVDAHPGEEEEVSLRLPQ